MSDSITASQIKRTLRAWLVEPEYLRDHMVGFDEFTPATGAAPGNNTRMDMWLIDLWPSNRLERTAIEIKCSRSDFMREINQPKKRRYALLYSNKFYFAAPVGLIKVKELPVECGLLEIDGDKLLRTAEAPFRETLPPTWAFVAAIARRVAKQGIQPIQKDEVIQ